MDTMFDLPTVGVCKTTDLPSDQDIELSLTALRVLQALSTVSSRECRKIVYAEATLRRAREVGHFDCVCPKEGVYNETTMRAAIHTVLDAMVAVFDSKYRLKEHPVWQLAYWRFQALLRDIERDPPSPPPGVRAVVVRRGLT